MIHEQLPSLTETAFGSHPCRVVSVAYCEVVPFHSDSTLPTGRVENCPRRVSLVERVSLLEKESVRKGHCTKKQNSLQKTQTPLRPH